MRPFLVAFALAALAGAIPLRPGLATEAEPGLQQMQGSWAIDSAPGVFGLSHRLTIDGNQMVRPDAPFPTTIGSVAVGGDWLAIRFEGRGGLLLRRETPDRLCGWGPLGPMTDMRTELNRASPPFCLVRLKGRPPE